MLEYFTPTYIKNRISREFTEMSTTRKIVYGVVFAALIGIVAWMLIADPFAVHTGATKIVKKHQ